MFSHIYQTALTAFSHSNKKYLDVEDSFFGFNNGIWQHELLQNHCIQIVDFFLQIPMSKYCEDITESLKCCISLNYFSFKKCLLIDYTKFPTISFSTYSISNNKIINTPENIYKKYNQTYFKTNESNFWKLIRDKLIYHDRSDEP